MVTGPHLSRGDWFPSCKLGSSVMFRSGGQVLAGASVSLEWRQEGWLQRARRAWIHRALGTAGLPPFTRTATPELVNRSPHLWVSWHFICQSFKLVTVPGITLLYLPLWLWQIVHLKFVKKIELMLSVLTTIQEKNSIKIQY